MVYIWPGISELPLFLRIVHKVVNGHKLLYIKVFGLNSKQREIYTKNTLVTYLFQSIILEYNYGTIQQT